MIALAAMPALQACVAPPNPAYTVDWEEDFSDPTEYAKYWSFRGAGLRDGYLNTPDMVQVEFDKGELTIWTKFAPPPSAGMVSTQGRKNFFLGYFEAEITLPKQPGSRAAFWLKSDNYDAVGDPKTHGAEIDIMEYYPSSPTDIFFNIHTFGYGSSETVVGTKVSNVVAPGETHIFGLEWTPNAYTFYIDGVARWTTNTSISGVPEYIILSSEIPDWGTQMGRQADDDEVRFRFVRHYAVPDADPSR